MRRSPAVSYDERAESTIEEWRASNLQPDRYEREDKGSLRRFCCVFIRGRGLRCDLMRLFLVRSWCGMRALVAGIIVHSHASLAGYPRSKDASEACRARGCRSFSTGSAAAMPQ